MNAIEKLKELEACTEAIKWCKDNDIQTVQEAWEKCERGDWMLWLYYNLCPDDIIGITLAKGHCANTVRHLMKDERSIKAVDTAIRYGEGKATDNELKAASDAAAYASDAAASASASAAYASDAAYACAADAYATFAKKETQKLTAEICRKYLKLKESEL